MPNPVSPLKSLYRLSKRQKVLAIKIKKAGLKPMVYHRKGNRNKLSVLNPFKYSNKLRLPKYRKISRR